MKFSELLILMAKDNQSRMPSSQGGLVQYYEADSGIEMDPKTVIASSIGAGVFVITLHMGIFI